jgi:NAD(P)-dependent dehydrogenase (short-subunit alcohol dehydrogenase family)
MSVYGSSKWALEGMSQALAQEVAPLGIRTLIVQPGAFTTNMMNAVNTTTKPLTEDYKSTEVGKWVKYFEGETTDFAAPNDVDKGCQGIFEAVTGTARGEDKEKLLRMPLSSDAAVRTKEHSARLLEGYDAWKPIWESTLHDGGAMKTFAKK